MADPYKYFRVEGREIVDELGKDALALEKGVPAREVVARMLRLAHTLKGAARVVKQREIADLAHTLEDALAPFRDDQTPGNAGAASAILQMIDAIAGHLVALAPQSPPEVPKGAPAQGAPAPPKDALPAVVRVATEGAPVAKAPEKDAPPAAEMARTVRADVDEMDALLDGIAEVGVRSSGVRRAASALGRARQVANALAMELTSAFNEVGSSGSAQRRRALADQLEGMLADTERDVLEGLDQTDREIYLVRDTAERLRLVPAQSIFNTLERAARDAAVRLGKRVTFEAVGGHLRLDADVLRAIERALVQAVRNAVAHGIETEAARARAGKPGDGHITVTVAPSGDFVSFACKDDGQGVDLRAVRRVAEQRGMIEKGGGLADADLLRLLMAGGISTASGVNEIAGRGVGLDVVREVVARLGGTCDLRTAQGEGTSLSLVIPVSLSSVDALIIEDGGQRAAVPLHAVRRTMRIVPSAISRTGQGDSIVVEGDILPFAALQPSRAKGEVRGIAVIVEHQGRRTALGVQRLVGTQNVLLRPLPPLTPRDVLVAGVSLDQEGNPELVLDPAGLVARSGSDVVLPISAERAPILVIDDSLTTRMLEQSILESAGYEVETATSAEEGLQKAREKQFSLFLVDVEMPGMDGFGFVELTRQDPELRVVPAILVTSCSTPEHKERGRKAGAAAYIVKSEFDQTEFLGKVRQMAG